MSTSREKAIKQLGDAASNLFVAADTTGRYSDEYDIAHLVIRLANYLEFGKSGFQSSVAAYCDVVKARVEK